MAFNLPENRKEVVDRMKTDVQSALPDSKPFLPNSFIGASITGFGGRIFDNYEQLKEILKQMFPDSATGAFLKRWGSYVNKNPNPATQAQGPIVVTGTATTILPNSTTFNSATGNQYLTQAEVEMAEVKISVTSINRSGSLVTVVTSDAHNFATGMQITISGAIQTDYNGSHTITVTALDEFTYTISTTPATPATGTIFASYIGASVEVKSVDFGKSANQPSGSQLTIATPIDGINSIARVQFSEISGGTDDELDPDYKKRVLFRYQHLHALFNDAEVKSKALEVSGVTRVWVFPITPVIGDVTVYFTRDNDDDIIPDPSEIKAVKDKILTIKPVDMDDSQVHVLAPTPVAVDFVFSALSPNTSAMHDAIRENLKFFLREGTTVSQDLVSDAYRSVIYQTIDATGAGVTSFALSSPAGDVTINDGEIAVFNSITFP